MTTPATCDRCGAVLSRSTKGTLCQRHQPGPPPTVRPYRAPKTPDVSRDPAARRYEGEGDGALNRHEKEEAARKRPLMTQPTVADQRDDARIERETAKPDARSVGQRRDDDTKAQNERRRRHQKRGKP